MHILERSHRAQPEALRCNQHHRLCIPALQEGTTPLHLAAYTGKARAVQLLLSSGASVHAQNCDGQTPLFEAAAAGHREAAELLLCSGADTGSNLPLGLMTSESLVVYGNRVAKDIQDA